MIPHRASDVVVAGYTFSLVPPQAYGNFDGLSGVRIPNPATIPGDVFRRASVAINAMLAEEQRQIDEAKVKP